MKPNTINTNVPKPAKLRQFSHALWNVLFPPACLSCAAPVLENGTLCADCWPQVHWLDGHSCARCHAPVEFQIDDTVLCASCLQDPPQYHKARAVMAYTDISRPLITRLKYADDTHLSPTLAHWMVQAAAPLLPEVDVMVPVPMHWRRMMARRFNQAALLARELKKSCDIPLDVNMLKRVKYNPPQAALTRAERLKNMRGAFMVPAHKKAQVAHKRVLLVDDVITTGATVNACARALTKAGAEAVYVLAFTKTL